MKHPDPSANLRYSPAFSALAVVSGVALPVLFSGVITVGFVDQVLLPYVHPVTLGPGDRVEVGSGGYRPVLVRHADGSVTDTGELPTSLAVARVMPALLLAGVVWASGLYGVARWWPKKVAAEPVAAADGGRPAGPL